MTQTASENTSKITSTTSTIPEECWMIESGSRPGTRVSVAGVPWSMGVAIP